MAANSYIKVGSEIMLVTAVNTNDLTVTRGQSGTTAVDHVNGAKVYLLTESTLSAAITSTTATSAAVTLNTGGLEAAVNDYLLIGNEVLKVTGIGSAPTLDVSRGQDGTAAGTIADGVKVFLLADPLRQIDAYDGRARG